MAFRLDSVFVYVYVCVYVCVCSELIVQSYIRTEKVDT